MTDTKWTITEDGEDSSGSLIFMVRRDGEPFTRAFSRGEAERYLERYREEDPGFRFRLTIIHDDGAYHLNPNEEDNLFKLHSFSNRHTDFTDPDGFLRCQFEFEDEDGYQGYCDNMPHEPNFRDPDDPELPTHDYEGPEGWFLSYFEHTNCRWGLQGTMSGMPDFRWDGVEFAGFLEVTVPEDEREWWDGRPKEDREKAAEAFVQEYTDWANGEVYGYQIEQILPTLTCELGYKHEQVGDTDSCFGFIGFEWIQEEVRGVTHWMGATEDNTEIVDEAYGIAEYGRWFVTEDEAREIDNRLAKMGAKEGMPT